MSTYSECLLSLLALTAWLEKYQEVQVLRHGLGVLSDVGVANRDWLEREYKCQEIQLGLVDDLHAVILSPSIHAPRVLCSLCLVL